MSLACNHYVIIDWVCVSCGYHFDGRLCGKLRVNDYTLDFGRDTYKLHAYTTDHYDRDETVILRSDKLADWLRRQASMPHRKIEIYRREKTRFRNTRWTKLTEVHT